MIDVAFEKVAEASRMLERLRELWTGPAGAVMRHPAAWIVETVESKAV